MTMIDDEVAWLKAVAKRVKIIRVEHDWAQVDLAQRASLTRNKISAIERCADSLKVYEINRIARAAGVELADLLDGAPYRTRQRARLPPAVQPAKRRCLMDPDVALDELLSLLDRMQTLVEMHLPSRVIAQDTRRLLELIDALDGWLTSGGFLPRRWKPAARHAN